VDVTAHLDQFTDPGDEALVFTSPSATPLRPGNFPRRAWAKAIEAAGLQGIHFHDPRHTGNNLTAAADASLRELIERMGHSSTRAALIYQHSSAEAAARASRRLGRARHCQARLGARHLTAIWPGSGPF
jgi:integrase